MLVPVLLIIVGFVLLIKGADFLVDGSSAIAKRFHIPEIVIGLTIVSIGTSLPELLVSINSATKGYSDMSLGNVIGSNICNLLLILGVSASIRRLKLKRETRYIEVPLCIAYTLIFLVICNTGNLITRPEAVVLLVLFNLFIAYTVAMGIKGEKFDSEPELENADKEHDKVPVEKNKSIIDNILKIAIGIVGLKFGGDFIVDNSIIIAEFLGISEKVISLTIIAIGTSLPELVTSVVAAVKGNSDISVGNIIGSNIFNMTFIIGIASLIKPITYNIEYNSDLLIFLGAGVLLFLFQYIPPKNMVSKRNGVMYLICYILYMVKMFVG